MLRPLILLFSILAGLASQVSSISVAQARDGLLVFAAASTRNALESVIADFKARSGIEVRVSYAGSGALTRQIINGAPADLYLSAHPRWSAAIQSAGIKTDASCEVANNELVIVAADGVKGEANPLINFSGQRIAVGDVRSVPAGLYAKAALEKLGLWQALRRKIAQTANVRLALALAERGDVDLAIVYASDANAATRARVVWRIPRDLHPPIRYTALAIRNADKPNPAAPEFMTYLCSEAGRAAFLAHGFIRP